MITPKTKEKSLQESDNTCIPQPRLQQLAIFESELIYLIGKRSVDIDYGVDIFTRIQEIYLKYLQTHTSGLQMLQKCLSILGENNAPFKVKMMYYLAHQMQLRYSPNAQIEQVLLQVFHSNLTLRNKLLLGFKSGLVFSQMSHNLASIEKVICALIVTLEQLLQYRHHLSLKCQSTYGRETIKSIYMGSHFGRKSATSGQNHSNKIRKLELYFILFEVYITASCKIQSEAKRKYYSENQKELRMRLIREYPGLNIEKQLNSIEQIRFKALSQFSEKVKVKHQKIAQQRFYKQKENIFVQLFQNNIKSQSNSPTQFKKTTDAQSLQNSMLKEEFQLSSTAQTTFNNSTKFQSQSVSNQSFGCKWFQRRKSISTRQVQVKDEEVITEQKEAPVQTDSLIFQERSNKRENKLNRLNDIFAIKKKKLKLNFNWQNQQLKENRKQNSEVIKDLPKIQEQKSQQISQTNQQIQVIPSKQAHNSLFFKQTINLLFQKQAQNPKLVQENYLQNIDHQEANFIEENIEEELIEARNHDSQLDMLEDLHELHKINEIPQNTSSQKGLYSSKRTQQMSKHYFEDIHPQPQLQRQLQQAKQEDPQLQCSVLSGSDDANLEDDQLIQQCADSPQQFHEIEMEYLCHLFDKISSKEANNYQYNIYLQISNFIQRLYNSIGFSELPPIRQDSIEEDRKAETSHTIILQQALLNDLENIISPLYEDKKDLFSHYTCSNFLGSNIDIDKDSDIEWRTFMNEIQNEPEQLDGIEWKEVEDHPNNGCQEQLETVKVPEQIEQLNCSHQSIQSDSSKKQEDAFVGENLEEIGKQATIQESEIIDVSEYCRKFNHWLQPKIKVKTNEIIFVIKLGQVVYSRQQFLGDCLTFELIEQICRRVQDFLKGYPKTVEEQTEQISIIKHFNLLNFIPDQIEIKTITLNQGPLEDLHLKFWLHRSKQLIIISSQNEKIKSNPIDIAANGSFQEIYPQLIVQNIVLLKNQVFVKGLWLFLGFRHIKLRQRSDTVKHLTVDILELLKEGPVYNYHIRQSSQGQSMILENVIEELRLKVCHNIQTIIGYCVKVNNSKLQFNTQNIHNFLKLL